MKFFTPELYLRYNSADETEANRADEEWERTLRQYRNHLKKKSKNMSDRVKDLAERLCLHDAEWLSLQADVPSPCIPPLFPFSSWVATLAVRSNGNITVLIYFLWKEIEQSHPREEWPFSKLSMHWLYDEIDVKERPSYLPLYWHRILWSDGRVVSIPFFDVVIQSFSEQNPESALVTKNRA
jgi:hypothetical protein